MQASDIWKAVHQASLQTLIHPRILCETLDMDLFVLKKDLGR
jgi:hypothetical protein